MASLRWLKIIGLILIIAVVQVNVLPALWFLQITPDLLLITVILLAMNIGKLPRLMIFAFLCGLLKDIFGIRFFGFNTLMFGFYAFCVYFILKYLYRETGWIEFIFLLSATFLHYIILTFIIGRSYIAIGVIEAAMNCLLMPPIAKCLQPIITLKAPRHNVREV